MTAQNKFADHLRDDIRYLNEASYCLILSILHTRHFKQDNRRQSAIVYYNVNLRNIASIYRRASIIDFIKFEIMLCIRFFREYMAKRMFLKRANCVVLSEKTHDCDTFLRFDKKKIPSCERSRAHLLIRSTADIDFNRQWVRKCVRSLLCSAAISDFLHDRLTSWFVVQQQIKTFGRMYNFELLKHSPAKKKTDINFILWQNLI